MLLLPLAVAAHIVRPQTSPGCSVILCAPNNHGGPD